jgi:hypothetical protein
VFFPTGSNHSFYLTTLCIKYKKIINSKVKTGFFQHIKIGMHPLSTKDIQIYLHKRSDAITKGSHGEDTGPVDRG